MKLHLKISKDNWIYLIIWIMLFMAPIVSVYLRTTSDTTAQFEWSEVFRTWKIFSIYLFIFLIHNFIIAPLLIYKHKKLQYLGTTICLLIVFMTYQCMNHPDKGGPQPRGCNPQEMRQPGMGPQGPQGPQGPTPPEFNQQPKNVKGHKDARMNKPFFKHGNGDRHDMMPPYIFGEIAIINTIMAIMMLGMNLGIKLYFKTDKDAKELQQLEKQNLEQQLEYLKYQINPHFFMNTLNNIHALVDIDPGKAKTTIVELSKMMRYILYEGNKPLIPLQREIQFLNNYITLMRLRYTENVDIKVDIPQTIPDKDIPPLLLITFVENAFKHGVSYQAPSFILVEMRFAGNRFYFGCKNSKFDNSTSEHGGVGLTNVKKRLELIYKNSFTLDINDSENEYDVRLDLPLTNGELS